MQRNAVMPRAIGRVGCISAGHLFFAEKTPVGKRAVAFISDAERKGFEPSIRDKAPYNGLAIRRFQPLSHLSIDDSCAVEL